MIADRCTETSRATATDLCTSMAMELRASCCRLSWGTKPGSTTLNLNQEAIDWMAPYDIPKEEIQHVPYAGKTVSLSGWGVILVSLLPRESTAISNCHTETLGSLNDCFCQVHPTKKMSEVTMLDFIQDCAQQRLPQILNRQCAASTLQFSPCTIRISAAWSFKKKKKKNPVSPSHYWQATAEYHMSVAAEEVGKLLLEWNTYSWSWVEECCWQDADYIQK